MTKEFKFNDSEIVLLKDCLYQERVETSKYTLERLTECVNKTVKINNINGNERFKIYHEIKDVIDYYFKRISNK